MSSVKMRVAHLREDRIRSFVAGLTASSAKKLFPRRHRAELNTIFHNHPTFTVEKYRAYERYHDMFIDMLVAAFPSEGFENMRHDHRKRITKQFLSQIEKGELLPPPPRTVVVKGRNSKQRKSNNELRAWALAEQLKTRLVQARAVPAKEQVQEPVLRKRIKSRMRQCSLKRCRAAREAARPQITPATDAQVETYTAKLARWMTLSASRTLLPSSELHERAAITLRKARLSAPAATLKAMVCAALAQLASAKPANALAVVTLNVRSAHVHLLASVNALSSELRRSVPADLNVHSFDVIMLQEIHTNAKIGFANIPGYISHQQPRLASVRNSGGTAILVRSCHPSAVASDLSSQSTAANEAEWLSVRVDLSPYPITFIAVYRPPTTPLGARANELANTIARARALGAVVLGGDFNLDFVRPRPNDGRHTATWANALAGLHRVSAAGNHAATTHLGNAMIDYLYNAHLPAAPPPARTCATASDHLGVWTLLPKVTLLPPTVSELTRVNWKRAADEPAKMALVATAINTVLTGNAAPTTATGLCQLVQDKAAEELGYSKSRADAAKILAPLNRKPWYTAETKRCADAAKRAVRRLHELAVLVKATPPAKAALLQQRTDRMNAQQREASDTARTLARAVTQAKRAFYDGLNAKLVPGYAPDVIAAHRTLAVLSGARKNVALQHTGDELLPVWSAIMGPPPDLNFYDPAPDAAHFAAQVEHLRRVQPEYDLDFAPGMVQLAISQLPTRKAPGPDGIPNSLWQALGLGGDADQNAVCKWLATYASELLRKHDAPIESCLQKGVVVLIPKSAERADSPSAYRPITLLNTITKLTETVVFARIKPRLLGSAPVRNMTHNLYDPLSPVEQAGFVPSRNTTQQSLLLRLAREFARRAGSALYILGYDQAKAFDTVKWPALLRSMADSGRWHWRECQFASRWMRGHERQLRLRNALSASIRITQGTPQGGVLSPTLYNEYVRVLCHALDALADDADPNRRILRVHFTAQLQMATLLYADDTTALANSIEDLRRGAVYGANEWAARAGSKFNTSKYAYMRLQHAANANPLTARMLPEPIDVGGANLLKATTMTTLLGVQISSTHPDHVQIIDAATKHELSAAVDAMPRFLSPARGAPAVLSMSVMRAAIELKIMHPAGASRVDEDLLDKLALQVCRTALGQPLFSKKKRIRAFCGWPLAASTALKLQLSLVSKSPVLGPHLLEELRRPFDAKCDGSSWRNLLVERLRAIEHRDFALPNMSIRNATPIICTALADALQDLLRPNGSADKWNRVVLDPIRDKLWPEPHPALRWGGRDAHIVFRFLEPRLIPVFVAKRFTARGLAQPLCPLCGQHVFVPIQLLISCRHAEVAELLSAPARHLQHAQSVESHTDLATYRARVRNFVQMPSDMRNAPDAAHIRAYDDAELAKLRKHLHKAVVRDACAILHKIWLVIKGPALAITGPPLLPSASPPSSPSASSSPPSSPSTPASPPSSPSMPSSPLPPPPNYDDERSDYSNAASDADMPASPLPPLDYDDERSDYSNGALQRRLHDGMQLGAAFEPLPEPQPEQLSVDDDASCHIDDLFELARREHEAQLADAARAAGIAAANAAANVDTPASPMPPSDYDDQRSDYSNNAPCADADDAAASTYLQPQQRSRRDREARLLHTDLLNQQPLLPSSISSSSTPSAARESESSRRSLRIAARQEAAATSVRSAPAAELLQVQQQQRRPGLRPRPTPLSWATRSSGSGSSSSSSSSTSSSTSQ